MQKDWEVQLFGVGRDEEEERDFLWCVNDELCVSGLLWGPQWCVASVALTRQNRVHFPPAEAQSLFGESVYLLKTADLNEDVFSPLP